jgi:hypothetical protein
MSGTDGGAGGYFDDALLGADGTGQPPVREGYGDALAQDTAPAQEWGGFALPRLPVAPGGNEQAARALVEADELPGVRVPAPVPAGQWGQLQPAPAPGRTPEPVPSWSPPAGWPGATPGWQAPPARRAQPAPRRPALRPAPEPPATLRSSPGPLAILAVLLLILVVGLVLLP